TPSPHRFITKTPSHSQLTKPTSLRTQQTISQSPRQFAPTPKFAPRRFAEDPEPPDASTSPLPSRLARSTFQALGRGEEIDEFSSSPTAKLSIQEGNGVSHSIKPSVEDIGERQDQDNDGLTTEASRLRKRRRESTYSSKYETIHISSSPSPSSPLSATSAHSLEDSKEDEADLPPHPTLLPPNHQTPHSRFCFSKQQTPQDPASQVPTRPSFLIPAPPIAPPEITPLPEAFSPHRRGGVKYIPGGLASTVREWILELPTKSAASNDGTIEGGIRTDVRDVKVGQGLTMVRGTEVGSKEEKWLLLGRGKGEGEVRRGGKVGIKKPVWDVNIESGDGEGERWKVGIDWSIL
ncbi:MAG: hypothetical protein Q9187_007671, partial [Circinaria calcarea]